METSHKEYQMIIDILEPFQMEIKWRKRKSISYTLSFYLSGCYYDVQFLIPSHFYSYKDIGYLRIFNKITNSDIHERFCNEVLLLKKTILREIYVELYKKGFKKH